MQPVTQAIRRQDTAVLFLHIPKAAGLTLYDILDREYGRESIYTFSGGRERLEAGLRQFENTAPLVKAGLHLVRGHFPFGIHTTLPHPAYTYITLLREPVARAISHYRYVCSTPHHLLHQQVVSPPMSLETYVASGINYEMDNGQTRQIAGVGAEIPFGACTPDLLAQAQHHLETAFAVVGLVERFDETLLLLQKQLNWQRTPVYVKKNVGQIAHPRTAVSPETRQLIAQHNQLDIALYAYAQQRFETVWQQIDPEALARFRRRKARYEPIGRLNLALRQLARRWLSRLP